jgi:hypothetical protein
LALLLLVNTTLLLLAIPIILHRDFIFCAIRLSSQRSNHKAYPPISCAASRLKKVFAHANEAVSCGKYHLHRRNRITRGSTRMILWVGCIHGTTDPHQKHTKNLSINN